MQASTPPLDRTQPLLVNTPTQHRGVSCEQEGTKRAGGGWGGDKEGRWGVGVGVWGESPGRGHGEQQKMTILATGTTDTGSTG
jgi:hypothetical protein